MKPAVVVRRAGEGDGARIAGVAEAVRFRTGQADGRAGYLVYVLTAEEYAEKLRAPEAAGWVAEDETGRTLGFVLCERESEGCWYLDQIGIDPGARGLGIGAALHAAVVEELKPARMECHIMHGPVRNERSRGFFLTQGWREEGEEDAAPFVWGRYGWEASAEEKGRAPVQLH